MSYSQQVWGQLKSITADEIISALKRDGWKVDQKGGSAYIFRHADKRVVSVHYHPRKTYGEKLLKGLLADIGWTEADMRRVKLIK